MDSLRVLYTDPVDYLVTPRVLASMIAGPILNVLCFCMGKFDDTVVMFGLYAPCMQAWLQVDAWSAVGRENRSIWIHAVVVAC